MTLNFARLRPMLFLATIAIGGLGVTSPKVWSAPLGTGVRSTTHDSNFLEDRLPHFPVHAPPVAVSTVSDLNDMFSQANYTLEDVGTGQQPVPGIFLANLPTDLAEINDPSTLKTVFIQALLPLILQANQAIRSDRVRLVTLRSNLQRGDSLQFLEEVWLEYIVERYEITAEDPNEQIRELLIRVDEIPTSLALAQAIEESGWGTSKPARRGNSLFGHTVFMADGAKIRSFDSLSEGIEAYFHNLNTHRAYHSFRQERAAMRAKGTSLDSHQLVGKLTSYSVRKSAYIATLRSLMRGNSLRDYDDARLTPQASRTTSHLQYTVSFP